MKIYIFADMEGISGISGSEFIEATGDYYSEGRILYTQDINVCVEGCFKAGATEVVVRDGHSCGKHCIVTQLDSRVKLIQGATPNKRFFDIENSDGIIFLGYHAMAGTLGALLEHTYNSSGIQNLWLNGNKVGEFAIDASIASEYNVPTIMISGDDKACKEAKSFAPDVVTCEVKKGIGCQSTELLPLEVAHKLIEEKTIEAVKNIKQTQIIKVKTPITIKKEVIERGLLKTGKGIETIDARTTQITGNNVEELFFRIM